jgi:hypothetical protein
LDGIIFLTDFTAENHDELLKLNHRSIDFCTNQEKIEKLQSKIKNALETIEAYVKSNDNYLR